MAKLGKLSVVDNLKKKIRRRNFLPSLVAEERNQVGVGAGGGWTEPPRQKMDQKKKNTTTWKEGCGWVVTLGRWVAN